MGSMTKQQIYENGASLFSQWLRGNEVAAHGLSGKQFASVTDIDFVWFAYRKEEAWYILLEEKCYGKTPEPSQNDTLSVITQHLYLGSERKHKLKTWRGSRPIEFRGTYVISFEQTFPNDSQWIDFYFYNLATHRFERQRHGKKNDLIYLLRYGSLSTVKTNMQEIPFAKKVVKAIEAWPEKTQEMVFDEMVSHQRFSKLIRQRMESLSCEGDIFFDGSREN